MGIIAFVAALNAQAQSLSDYQLLHSKPVGNSIMQLALRRIDGLFLSGPIEYDWLAATNKGGLVNLPKDEYFCSARVIGPNGKAVPFRKAFENLGKHFYDLKYPAGEQPGIAIDDTLRIRPTPGTQAAAGEVVFAGEKTEEGGSFYNLEDVFEMKEPGEYKVSLQLQAYERMYKGGQIFMFQLDRFEPFEFIVTKIAPRKANDFSLWVGMCVCPYKLFSRHPLENSKPKEFYRTPAVQESAMRLQWRKTRNC
jgi:hypothetical protein